jgi:hypothetical protein
MIAQCMQINESLKLSRKRSILSSTQPYQGFGFLSTIAMGIFVGAPVILFNQQETVPAVILDTLSSFKGLLTRILSQPSFL